MFPMFFLGKLANNVHSEKSSSAMLQECITGREQLTFSLGNLKCAARASCGAKILYTIYKNPAFSTMETPLGVLFLRHRVFYECLCFIRIAPIREMELGKPEQKGTEDSLWTTVTTGTSLSLDGYSLRKPLLWQNANHKFLAPKYP